MTGPPQTLALFSTRIIHPGPSEVSHLIFYVQLIFFILFKLKPELSLSLSRVEGFRILETAFDPK